jgi:hypothetical protein
MRAGKLLILAPDSVFGLDTLTRDRAKMDALYQKGYGDASQIAAFIRESQ